MLCFAGVFAGLIAGAYMGVPWAPYLTIPLGTTGGLLADITIFGAFERKKDTKEELSVFDQQCYAILNTGKKMKHVQSALYE